MNIAKDFYFLAIVVLLLFGSSIRTAIGLMGEESYYKINPSIYFLILSLSFTLFTNKRLCLKINYESFPLGVFGVIMIVGKFVTHIGGYLPVVNNVLIPFLFCLLLPKRDLRFINQCYKFLLCFFTVESVWAVFERIFLVNVFPPVSLLEQGIESYSELEGFRSSALLGSPLTNSLCLTAILVFILMSDMKRNFKIVFFSIGYLGVLCFNTRTSIILWPILLVVSLLYTNFKKRGQGDFLKLILIFVVLSVLFASVIVANGLGDRLFGKDLMDNSANVRVDTWNMFLSIDFISMFFSFGMKIDDIESLMLWGNVGIIENSWVLYFLELGGLGLVMLLVGYYFIFSKAMRGQTLFFVVFTLGSFIILGSTNNGLKEIAMSLFIICCYIIPKALYSVSKLKLRIYCYLILRTYHIPIFNMRFRNILRI